LELTVRHFHNLKRQNKFYIKSEQSYADRFRDGFSQCAKEVTKFLYTQHNRAGESIILHLNDCMRRLDNLTNASNNMQITNNNNNNNYIPNDALQLDISRQQQASPPSSFVVPSSHHHHHLQQNIRQTIAIPLVRKSPIPPQNYVPQLPSLQHQLNAAMESRMLDNESPLLRPISRDSMSSPPSTSSSPINGQDNMWRPW
jgi:hypothetical protein